MIDASTIPRIQARHFKPGRTEAVRVVVVHTTEGPTAPGVARAVANWFAGASAPEASAHYIVGPDEIVSCVAEEDTAWHAPPANAYAIGIEHAGRASFTAADWAGEAPQAMLAKSAELVADICARHGIPVVFLDDAALQRGDAGITTHAAVSRAFHQSDHTDPGPSFPMADYLALVHAAMPTVDAPTAES